MTIRKTWLPILTAGAFAIAAVTGLAGKAQAGAVAYATLDISGFKLIDHATGIQLDTSAFSALLPSTTTTASSELGGVTNTSPSNPTDVALACVGACAGIAQNDFALQTPILTTPIPGSFARGDAVLDNTTGSLISAPALPNGGAAATGVAETQILGGGIAPGVAGNANSTISSTAGFVFTLAAATTVRADFTADPRLLALLDGIAAPGSVANASISFQIRVTHVDAILGTVTDFLWTPDGAAGGIIGTEIADPFSLNTNAGAIFPGTSSAFDPAAAAFSARTTAALLAGIQYTLTISHTQVVDARSIPEPMTLVLTATGLLGLGLFGQFSRRRRRSA